MSSNNLHCPECGAVLRSAKPLRPGKSVNCPKCGAGFVVGQDEPRPAARAKAPAPAKKKAAPSPVPVAPVMPVNDDDEDGGGTYTVKTEKEDEGPLVNYAPDTSIRDLRGPAMLAVVNPSNKLMIVGATGFLGWVAFAVVLIIPLLFPLRTEEDRERARLERERVLKEAEAARKPPPPDIEEASFFKIGDLDLGGIADLPWYLIVLCMLPLLLGMAYSAALAMGAVKVQNLESREWGIASSIMAMVPFNAGGLLMIEALALNLVLDLVFDGFTKWFYLGIMLVCAWASNLAVGIWMLTTLNKPEVVAGFEFVPE